MNFRSSESHKSLLLNGRVVREVNKVKNEELAGAVKRDVNKVNEE